MSKVSVKLYLSPRPTTKGLHLIFIFFTFQSKRFNFSTRESIDKKRWGDGRMKPGIGAVEFNKRLDAMRSAVETLLESGTITVENITEKIQQALTPLFRIKKKEEIILTPTPNARETFFQFIDRYIVETGVKPLTLVKYKGTRKYLQSFKEEVWKNKPLDFENIDMEFYDQFVRYLSITKNQAANSWGSHIKNVKVWMKQAYIKKKHGNDDFRQFKVGAETSESFALTEEEIDTIYNLPLEGTKGLEFARDMFIVACHTALRYSDIFQVKPEYIENNILTIRATKTKGNVIIPLHRRVREILSKYENNLPQIPANQTFNNHLKTIGKMASLDAPFTKYMTKGGKLTPTTYKKQDKLTFHTARRSAATNLYKRGVPSLTIMSLTGHKTERDFLKYIKIDAHEHAASLMRFFESQEVTVK